MNFKKKYQCSPHDAKYYDTQRLRTDFLIDDIFMADDIRLTYSYFDRIIVGGALPQKNALSLSNCEMLRSKFFLENRELGIFNIGGDGIVYADGKKYDMVYGDCLYVGMGTKEISFISVNPAESAKFYFNSTPAHKTYPTKLVTMTEAVREALGSIETSNTRVIHKYFHPNGIQSCQLTMGLTALDEGSVWNTMPCHTHERRMEVYLYFKLDEASAVFHFMGQPDETRHIVVRNEQAVISPNWSIHSGCGTKNYSFIWGMCGENKTFTDMDIVETIDIK